LETDLVVIGRLEDLCGVSLHKIKELTRDTKAFLRVLSVSTEEKTRLVDHHPFRDWIMGYMAQKSEVLKQSTHFKSEIMSDSELAWRICSLLMSSLGGMGNGTGVSALRTPPNE
jgi:hypothetical protein